GWTGHILGAQQVSAFEKADEDWYRIKTWFGDAWLQAKDATIGGPRIEKVDTVLTLLNDTQLYRQPNGIGWTGQSLNPQRITAFEKADDWYHVKTWFGDAWLQRADHVLVGEPEIESVQTVLTLLSDTPLYTQPYGLGNTGHMLDPQRVTAFERTGDWYRVKTWFGDAWLDATDAVIGNEEQTEVEAAPSEVLQEPEVFGGTELERKQVTFEVITPDQIDSSMQSWYDELLAENKATSAQWQGELYIFLPDG